MPDCSIKDSLQEIAEFIERERRVSVVWAARNARDGFPRLAEPHLSDVVRYDRWLQAIADAQLRTASTEDAG